jgi:hypothetical protein
MSDILTALSIKSLKNSNCAFDIIGNVSRYEKKLNKGSKWQRKHGHLVVLLADVDSVMCTLNGLMQGIILLFCTNSQCHKTQFYRIYIPSHKPHCSTDASDRKCARLVLNCWCPTLT